MVGTGVAVKAEAATRSVAVLISVLEPYPATEPVTLTEIWAPLVTSAALILNVDLVSPVIAVPSANHW